MVKILQQLSSSLSNFHSRNAYSPIFATGFSFEPCNPGSSALRKWWHTILERFRVFFCFWEVDLWFSVPLRHSKSNLSSTTTLSTLSVTAKGNWPFPSSKNSHFRNEAKFKTFLVKMKFICMRIKIIFISMASHLASLWNRGLKMTDWRQKSEISQNNLRSLFSNRNCCFYSLDVKAWQFLRLLFN